MHSKLLGQFCDCFGLQLSAAAGYLHADRSGVRIAAVRNHASTNALIPLLKQAQLVYADTPDPTFSLLRDSHADVMASVRGTLVGYSVQLPGSRVLEDHYGANINRIAIAKGNAERLAYINEFVEEAKASGLVQRAIERAGPTGLTGRPRAIRTEAQNIRSLSGVGTFLPCQPRRAMSVIRGRPADICSMRVLRILDPTATSASLPMLRWRSGFQPLPKRGLEPLQCHSSSKGRT